MLSVLLRAVASLFLCVISAGASAQPAELIVNGDMSAKREGRQPLVGWDNWLWSGEGAVQRYDVAGQPAAAVVRNQGPAKQAIFQQVAVAPCSYRMTAEVAASDIVADADGRATTFHIAFEGSQASITHDVFGADSSGWHRIEFNFTVERTTKALLYLFNYGTGNYFVRNVRISPVPGCPTVAQSYRLVPIAGAPPAFEAPLSAADFALAGYCGATAFQDRRFCSPQPPVAVAQPAEVAVKILADFESGPNIFPNAELASDNRTVGTGRSANLVKGRYLSTSPSQGLPSNWTGYDWLRVDTYNPSETPVAVYVEINDDKTTGYWSRVNWTTAAPPGRGTIDVPLRTFVGEKSVIKERRRLDLGAISRLVLTATDGNVSIDNVRLEREAPFAKVFPELVRFDLGPLTSPVMTGFTQLTADMTYIKRRGYGFAPNVRIGRIEDRRHPDDLFRDWISILSGGLDIDLPNGRYRVWMMLEDPGYWEYFPSATQRRVFVQGQEIEGGIRPYSDFARRFWRHADDEDLPGDDIWRRYIEPRYRPLTTTAVVENGQLNLRFNGNNDPHAVTLSALIVFPESKASEGEAFLAELFGRLRSNYEREYRHVPPPSGGSSKVPGTAPGNALGGALSVFTRSLALDIAANARPASSELADTFDVAVPRGETVPIVVGLLPNADLEIVSAKIQLPGLQTSLSTIRNKITRLTIDGTVFAALPRVLDPLEVSAAKPLVLRAGIARALLIEITAPPKAASEKLTAPLVLTFKDGRRSELLVEATVKPWSLPGADIPIGYLGTATRYPLATYPEIAQRRLAELKAGLLLLRQTGMTAVSGGLGGPRLVRYVEGKPQLDISQMRPSLKAISDAGYDEVLTYDGLSIEGLSTNAVSNTQELYHKPYVEVLRDVLTIIERERAEAGLRAIVHAIADEPADGDVPSLVEAAKAFKSAQPTAKTAAFISLADFANDPRRQLAGIIDRLYLTVHSEGAIRAIVKAGSACSLYNQQGRYARGIYLLKLRDIGCAGHMQFAYNSAHVDHWYDLDGREGDHVAVFTHPDGRLRRSMDLLRYRQSIDDYRYLMVVDKLADRGRSAAAVDARAWLDTLKRKMVVGAPSPFGDGELQDIRRTAVRHIDALKAENPAQ